MKTQYFDTILEALAEVVKAKEDKIFLQEYEISDLKNKLEKAEKEINELKGSNANE